MEIMISISQNCNISSIIMSSVCLQLCGEQFDVQSRTYEGPTTHELHLHHTLPLYHAAHIPPGTHLIPHTYSAILSGQRIMPILALSSLSSSQNEYCCRQDFLLKNKNLADKEEVELCENLNRLLLENVLPAHVAALFVGENKKNEVGLLSTISLLNRKYKV